MRAELTFAIVVGVLGSLCGGSLAAEVSPPGKELNAEEQAKIQARLNARDSLHLKFRQKVFLALRGRTVESEGQAYFAKPGIFRWVVAKPVHTEWFFDGKELTHYDAGIASATIYPSSAHMGREMVEIINAVFDLESLSKRYASKAYERGDKVAILLTPKSRSDIASIELDVVKPSFLIDRLKINYQKSKKKKAGNYTEVQFESPDAQGAVPAQPSDLQLKLPKGVRVNRVKI